MTNDIKRIDVAEFRRLGLLQEVNRLFFHPRGLALEINVGEDGIEHFGGVWDYRDDLEGMAFAENMISPISASFVRALLENRLTARRKLFGTLDGIQPLPGHEPEEDINRD